MAIRKTANTSRKPTGDTANIARKRFYRAAERYLKQAEASAGATAARYKELARLNLNDALKTYTKKTTQSFAKPIQKIANVLGIDLNQERELIKARSDETDKKLRERITELGDESKSLASLQAEKKSVDSDQLREEEARAILNSPIGQRIIGGTVEIWDEGARVSADNKKGYKTDKEKILPQLYDYFKVDSTAALLEKIEGITGELLYSHNSMDEKYEAVKLLIQNYIAENRTAAR